MEYELDPQTKLKLVQFDMNEFGPYILFSHRTSQLPNHVIHVNIKLVITKIIYIYTCASIYIYHADRVHEVRIECSTAMN